MSQALLDEIETKILFFAENFELKPQDKQIFTKALMKKHSNKGILNNTLLKELFNIKQLQIPLYKIDMTEYMKNQCKTRRSTVNLEKLDFNEYIPIAQLKRNLSKPYNLRERKIKSIKNVTQKNIITHKVKKEIKPTAEKRKTMSRKTKCMPIAKLKPNLSKSYNLRQNNLKFVKIRGIIHIYHKKH